MMIIISDRSSFSDAVRVFLSSKGVFLFSSALETGEFFCDKKEIGGAILDCVSDESAGEELCLRLRQKYSEMPIAAIVSEDAVPDLPADRILREKDLSLLLPEILDFCHCCGWDNSPLSVYHLYVDHQPANTIYMGYPLLLSHREHILLRCLFYRFPLPTSADDLIVLCYPDKVCRIGNIALLVRSINRRAAEIDPRPLIINQYGKGYLLHPDLFACPDPPTQEF